MKKSVLLIGGILVSLTAFGQSPQIPTAEWGYLIDGSTSAGDQSTDIAVDKNGNIYWYGTYGTTAGSPDVNYDGEFLFQGALLDMGNTQNNNLCILKTDKDGNKLWSAYSNSGDFAQNTGFCDVAADGGVTVVAKVRHTDGMTDRDLTIVDGEGVAHTIEWTCEKRSYRMMVVHLSADGELLWTRLIESSVEPGPSASGNTAEFWADTINIGRGCLDESGNIYIPLNLRNTLLIAESDGDVQVLSPSNTDSWTGDAQSNVGDFIILGLDPEGYYRGSISLEGECASSWCQNIIAGAGELYAQGYAIGAGSVITIGDIEMNPSDVISPIVMKFNSEFNVDWAKCFPGEKVDGKNAFQSAGLNIYGNDLYLCGMYNLKFSETSSSDNYLTATQGNIREGFILKMDSGSGEWQAWRDSRADDWDQPSAVAKTGLTGYLSVIKNPVDVAKIYVGGYVMNATVGVFLRGYDAQTLVGDLDSGQNTLVTGGGAPSAQCFEFDSESGALYFTVRGNKAFALSGGEESAAPAGWGILATKFDLGKEDLSTIEALVIHNPEVEVEYYNLQGIKIDNPTSGIYIRKEGTRVDKIVL